MLLVITNGADYHFRTSIVDFAPLVLRHLKILQTSFNLDKLFNNKGSDLNNAYNCNVVSQQVYQLLGINSQENYLF